jgi:hypothetical protein
MKKFVQVTARLVRENQLFLTMATTMIATTWLLTGMHEANTKVYADWLKENNLYGDFLAEVDPL